MFLRLLPAGALAGLGPGGVDVRSGHLLRNLGRRRDLLPAGPLGLGFERVYDSRLAEAGSLSAGWRSSWDVTLRVHAETVTFHDEWGRVLVLPRPEPGTQIVLASASLSLACLEDGQYVIANPRPAYLGFAPQGRDGVSRLASIEFLDGRRFAATRDGEGALRCVRNEAGMGLWFDVDEQGRTRSVARDPQSGPCVRYRYDADGYLVRVERVGGKPLGEYTYQGGLLAAISEGAGDWSIRWRGQGAGAQVAGLRIPSGRMWLRHVEREGRHVRMQASDGAQLSWRFDAQGRVAEYRDAEGGVYEAQYDSGSRLTHVAAPGGEFSFEYDHFGRVSREAGPSGRIRQVGYAHATVLPMMLSREQGRRWFWLRDKILRPRQRRAPGGVITDYEYDDVSGTRVTVRQDNVETRYARDAAGRLVAREEGGAGVSRYAWTDAGQLRAIAAAGEPLELRDQDDAGNLRVRVGEGPRARFAVYAPEGALLSQANAAGHAGHWRYDAQGRLEMRIDEEGVSTRYVRNAAGNDVTVHGPGGGQQRWVHDARRRVLARRDADGVMTESRLDTSGRVTRLLEAAGPMRADSAFHYDELGRLVRRDRAGWRWEFGHDALGRLTDLRAQTDGHETTLAFEYDAKGRVVGETSENGQLLRHLDAQGHVAVRQLPCGLMLFEARDHGQRAVQISYSIDGRTESLTSIVYDEGGHETLRVAGAVQREILRSDAAGERLERSFLAGGRTRIEGLDRHARRDPAGRLVEEEDAQGRRLYDYDRRGQLVRSIDDTGLVYTTWDSGGNIIALDAAGWAPPSPVPDHRPARVGSQVLGYDDWGRLLRRDGPLGGAAFTWDLAGRLVSAQCRRATICYSYDGAGRLAMRRIDGSSDAFTHRFVWEGLRLAQEITPLRRVTYVYAPARAGWQSFAPLARLIQRKTHAQAEWAAPQIEHLFADSAGRARVAFDADGRISWMEPVRPWGERVAGAEGYGAAMPGFAGHWVDPDAHICWNGLRFYDPLTGRYLSPDRDAPPGVSPYRYVGAPATHANPLGLAVRPEGVSAPSGVAVPEQAPLEWAGARSPPLRLP
ncbi:RHS repeat-associated core domain-containing protein [Achromobacter spanius]|uniref:RHS repeat-associated core domain-containing protein n=1 Tax=Achromobacter spanius TaxID=217203 RepID=UPI0038134D06